MLTVVTARQVLPAVFARFPAIDVVYLFGSTARGTTDPSSDFDIGLLCRADLSVGDEARLAAMLSPLVNTTRIDIVSLRKASPLLRYEVLVDGIIIYQCVSDDMVNQFEMQVYREYFDTEHIRTLQRDYLRAEYGKE